MSRKARLKTDPTLTASFVKLLRSGATQEEACEKLDVPLSCYKDWLRWGSRCDEHGSVAKEPFKTFAREVRAALRDFEGALVDEILRQGRDARYAHDVVEHGETVHKKGEIILNPKGYVARPGRWEANRFLLQTRFPKTYAPQLRIIIEQQLTTILDALERELDPPTYQRVMEIIARADQGGTEDGGTPPPPRPAEPEGGTGKATTH